MNFQQYDSEKKQRIVQELVPGKQITLAHIIANPDGELYEKLGLDPKVAIKSAGVSLGFVDRFSGSLIVTGTVSQVEASTTAILEYTENKLGYEVCSITRT